MNGEARQAVILAGGQGTRLRPLTFGRPKPVVPLLNRPFLAYQLALLREHGITDVILSCSYRVDDVRGALGDGGAFGMQLRYVVEASPLGTGGGVRNATDLTRGTIVVLNGDVLTDADLSAMRSFHEASGSRTTIFLIRSDNPRAYGLVRTGHDGRLQQFLEKPTADEEITTDTINAGIYLIDADLLARIPTDRPVSIEREFFPRLIADGIPSFGWLASPYWRDIGSPTAYLEAHVDLLDGRARMPLAPPGDHEAGNWLGRGVKIDARAVIEPPSLLGDDVTLGADCHVGPHAVLGNCVTIGTRARVQRTVLWERVQVGAGAVLRGCVVAADTKVGVHAELGPGVVLEAGAVVPERTRLPR